MLTQCKVLLFQTFRFPFISQLYLQQFHQNPSGSLIKMLLMYITAPMKPLEVSAYFSVFRIIAASLLLHKCWVVIGEFAIFMGNMDFAWRVAGISST